MKTTRTCVRTILSVCLILSFFNLASQPLISSFSPQSAAVGTTVTITGKGFSSVPANNTVYFGAVKANVANASGTALSVTVPAGAGLQPITVTTAGLTAASTIPFKPTFTGSLGLSATSFDWGADFTLPSGPSSVTTADFDLDGQIDLVFENKGLNKISIFRNTAPSGSYYYVTKTELTTSLQPRGLAIADIDGDGKKDIVVANLNATVSVFRNTSTTGVLSFASKIDFVTGNSPSGLAVGDMDKDGRADIVVANFGDSSISVLRNLSAPGFVSFATKYDFACAGQPVSIALTDADSDGKLDYCIANLHSVYVMRNISSAGTISIGGMRMVTDIFYNRSIYVQDLDEDFKPDILLTSNDNGGVLTIFSNTSSVGNPSFINYSNYIYPKNYIADVAVADVDGDARPEIAITTNNSKIVYLYKTRSFGNSIIVSSTNDYMSGGRGSGISIGDLNKDGRSDLIIANLDSVNNSFSILPSRITQTVTCSDTMSMSLTVPDIPCSINNSSVTITSLNGPNVLYSVDRGAFKETNTFSPLYLGTHTATIKFRGGCTVDSTFVVSQSANKVSASINVHDAICGSTGGSLAVTPTGGNQPFTYSLNATTFQQDSIFNNLFVGTHQVTVKDSLGCKLNMPFTVNSTGTRDTAIITPKGPLTICSGDSVLLTSSIATGNQWYFNGRLINGGTSDHLVASVAGSYRVLTNIGCTITTSDSVLLKVTPALDKQIVPDLYFYGDTVLCTGNNVHLYTQSRSGLRYQWFHDDQPIANAIDTSYYAAASGLYKVVLYSTCNLDSIATRSILITVQSPPPIPVINAGGPLSFCSGDSVRLTSSSATSNQWYVGTSLLSGINSNVLTARNGGTYRVKVTNKCGSAYSDSLTVNVSPGPLKAPVPNIYAIGDTNFCSGRSVLLKTFSRNGINYTWYKNHVAISGARDSTFNAWESGTYFVKVYSSCSGDSAESRSIQVLANPYPDTPRVTLSGPLNICNGASVTLTSSAADNYQWYKDGSPITGATSQSYTATAAGTYRIYTRNSCGNNASDPYTVTLSSTPATMVAPMLYPSRDTSLCQGSTIWIRTNKLLGLQYQWYKDGIHVGPRGTNDTALLVSVSGVYTIKAFNTCNGDSVASAGIRVSVIPNLNASITASGSLNICNGKSVVLTSSPAASYQWYRNWIKIQGATSQTYTASQAGCYYNLVTNACGRTAYDSVLVNVSNTPAVLNPPLIRNSGDTSFCGGGSVLLYTWSMSGVNYRWFKNGVPILGAIDTAYRATTTGIYSIKIYNNCNNDSATSIGKTVTVLTMPDTPRVQVNGPLTICNGSSVTLVSSLADNYQWYRNNTLISGATSQSFTATAAGIYRVFNKNNCGINASDPVVVSAAGISPSDELTPSPSMLWSPNHTMVNITIDYGSAHPCASAGCTLTITSNEPQNGLGDGDMDNDWEVVDAYHVKLRAERSGNGNGRIYTITAKCIDSSGTVALKTTVVKVPKAAFDPVVRQNPSHTEFMVNVASFYTSNVTMRVYKSNGNLIEARDNIVPGSTVVLGSSYPQGLYYVEFTQFNMKTMLRLLKL